MRKVLSLPLPYVLGSVALAACAASGFVSGCSTNPLVALDGSAGDMAMTPPADMAMAPDLASSQAIQGNKLTLGTFTLIGYAGEQSIIAYDQTKKAVVGIDTTTGTSKIIDSTIDTPFIHAGVVFTYDGVDQTTNIGAANAWTVSGGQNSLGGGNSRYGFNGASDDSAYIFYSDNTNTDATQFDIFVSKADGTNPYKVATSGAYQTMADPTACYPTAQFAGGKLLVRACGVVGDAGTPLGSTVYLVDPATGSSSVLATNVADSPFFVNPTATKLFVADYTSGAGWVITVSANPTSTAVGPDVKDGWILSDDANVIFVTSKGALVRAAISATPAPMTLVTMNATALGYQTVGNEFGPALAPDGNHLIFLDHADPTSGLGDIYLASTTTPGTPTMLAMTSGAIFGDAFTKDGSNVLYYTNCLDISTISGLIGTFNSQPVSGGTAASYGKASWVAYAGQGAKVVYDVGDTGSNATKHKPHGGGDLFFVDTAKTDAPTLIAPVAEADFYVNPAHTKVAFSITGVPAAGVYLYTMP